MLSACRNNCIADVPSCDDASKGIAPCYNCVNCPSSCIGYGYYCPDCYVKSETTCF